MRRDVGGVHLSWGWAREKGVATTGGGVGSPRGRLDFLTFWCDTHVVQMMLMLRENAYCCPGLRPANTVSRNRHMITPLGLEAVCSLRLSATPKTENDTQWPRISATHHSDFISKIAKISPSLARHALQIRLAAALGLVRMKRHELSTLNRVWIVDCLDLDRIGRSDL